MKRNIHFCVNSFHIQSKVTLYTKGDFQEARETELESLAVCCEFLPALGQNAATFFSLAGFRKIAEVVLPVTFCQETGDSN